MCILHTYIYICMIYNTYILITCKLLHPQCQRGHLVPFVSAGPGLGRFAALRGVGRRGGPRLLRLRGRAGRGATQRRGSSRAVGKIHSLYIVIIWFIICLYMMMYVDSNCDYPQMLHRNSWFIVVSGMIRGMPG